MIPRPLSTTKREQLYQREVEKAQLAKRGDYPICNIPWCDRPILPGEPWDESHYPRPRAFGGTITGCAHKKCNRLHGAKIVTPAVAKAKRQFRRDRDITRSAKPLPGGRGDRLKKKMNGDVERRS